MEREWDSGLASLAIHSLATVMSDMDAAIEWYERVLGFRLAARAEIAEGEVVLLKGRARSWSSRIRRGSRSPKSDSIRSSPTLRVTCSR